jgi:probable aminopeptidase NPEPL1
MPTIRITADTAELVTTSHSLVVVARKADLTDGWPTQGLPQLIRDAVSRAAADARPGAGAVVSTLVTEGSLRTVSVVALYDQVSRHLSDTRSYEISQAIKGIARPDGGRVSVILGLADAAHATGAVLGVARSYPVYTRKTTGKGTAGEVLVHVTLRQGPLTQGLDRLGYAADATALAQRLVDMPTAELDTAVFEAEARKALEGLANVTVTSIVGDDLLREGLRGLHAVGRTAMVAPRLVVLDYAPPSAEGQAPIALIGKGLVYDTGGLSLKIVGDRMLTMKCDMGGAAAVLGAFQLLVRANTGKRIVAALSMAENAIGPDAYRPDDILEMHSGKTVEVNNTDAEGRIALADAASYIARKYKPTVLIDAATLTGAQLVATGKWHAAIMSNDADLEARAVTAGLKSGDHCMAVMFSPELHVVEFKSTVADLRNSVADRNNASTSASGLWVYLHIEDLGLKWLHIDLAGPAFMDNRGTGYGIGLIAEIVTAL